MYVKKIESEGQTAGNKTYYVKVDGKYHKVLQNGDDVELEEAATEEADITGGNKVTYKVTVTSSDTTKTNVDVQYNESTGEVTIISTNQETTTDVTLTAKYVNKDKEDETKFEAKELKVGVVKAIEITPETAIGGNFDYDEASTGWEILYYDETKQDIYIISTESINEIGYTELWNIVEDKYNGTDDFLDLTNYPAVRKGLLSETYNNGTVLKKLTNLNMKITNYMLDKTNWNKYVVGDKADWAIGGPTLELLCLSFRAKNPSATNWPTVEEPNGYDGAGWSWSYNDSLPEYSVWNHYRSDFYNLASPSCEENDMTWVVEDRKTLL